VLRYELDYELSVYHEAITEGREVDMAQSKERLQTLRIEMIQLEL
jgi:hypothetical protein